MANLERRKGKFRISDDLIKQGDASRLLSLFGNMVIVRAEYLYWGCIEYDAYSPLFREVESCAVIPEYTITGHDIYAGEEYVRTEYEAKEIKG